MVKRGDPRPRRFFQDLDVRPWIQGIGAVSAVLLVLYIWWGLSIDVQRLDPLGDTDKLKEVFFGVAGNDSSSSSSGGGDAAAAARTVVPWCVLCHTNPAKPLHRPFQRAARALGPTGDIKFATVDCTAKLPSGKTIIQRLGLNKNIKPMVFLTAAAGSKKPRQLLPRYVATGDALIKELLSIITPEASKVRDTAALEEDCLGKELCLLVMKGTKYAQKEERVLAGLMKTYASSGVAFATVDSPLYELSPLEQRLPRYNPTVTRVVLFRNDAAKQEGGKSKRRGSASASVSASLKAKAFFGDFNKKELTEFLSDGLQGKLRFKQVEDELSVKKRSASSSSSSSSGGGGRKSSSGSMSGSSSSAKEERPPKDEGAGAPPQLSPEEEARLKAQREAKIREAMERERADFIQHVDEDGEEEGTHRGDEEEEEEEEEVIDLDEF